MDLYVKTAAHAALDLEWSEAFAALKAAGLRADADHPTAARYRTASDKLNHANRRAEAAALSTRKA